MRKKTKTKKTVKKVAKKAAPAKPTPSKILTTVSALRAAAPFMSKDQTRYYLNGVLFQNGLLVATDGARLVAIKPDEYEGSSDDFIMPAETIAAILRIKAPKYFELYFSADPKAGEVKIYIGKPGENEPFQASFSFTPVDGTFPDWLRIIPDTNKEKPQPQAFNAKYLGAFASLGKYLTLYQSPGKMAPCIIRADKGLNAFESFALLMSASPVVDEAIPSWIKKGK